MAFMSDEEFHFTLSDYQVFQGFLQDACGIVLGDNKQYLVANRVRRILENLDIHSLGELVKRIQQDPRSGLKEKVIDAMTTNETFWFRDVGPFETLRDVIINERLEGGAVDPLRIWSAACSSGQEPYSISMIIEEHKRKFPGVLKREPAIVATDISSSILEAAKLASYDGLSVSRGLSESRRALFFDALENHRFRVKSLITQRVEFRPLNLLESYATLGGFDIVFCRNVLIYFSAERKQDILRRMRATLRKGGVLVLGASESLPQDLNSVYSAKRGPNGSTYYVAI
ncbi:MAG: protein-glutamate O-methyltransferase CheR [Pseudohongiellaceae bacterium]|nr:protein-glutamate O-methyltransferase CheR [Pseudohongiellaceae bacterium]